MQRDGFVKTESPPPNQARRNQQETIMLRHFTAAALLVLCTGAARAGEVFDSGTVVESSVHVSYGDLNLTSSSDDKVLAARLAAAAKTVCASQPGKSYVDSGMQDCMSSAINTAISRIHDQLDDKLRASRDSDVREAMATP
jgi:UrcA family protein